MVEGEVPEAWAPESLPEGGHHLLVEGEVSGAWSPESLPEGSTVDFGDNTSTGPSGRANMSPPRDTGRQRSGEHLLAESASVFATEPLSDIWLRRLRCQAELMRSSIRPFYHQHPRAQCLHSPIGIIETDIEGRLGYSSLYRFHRELIFTRHRNERRRLDLMAHHNEVEIDGGNED